MPVRVLSRHMETESILKKLTKTVITIQIPKDKLVSLISWAKHSKKYTVTTTSKPWGKKFLFWKNLYAYRRFYNTSQIIIPILEIMCERLNMRHYRAAVMADLDGCYME